MDLSAIRNPVLGYNAYNLTAGAARFGTTDARHFNSSSSDPVLYFNCYSGFLASALPLGISNCSLGMYCPNISLDDVFTWPQVCPPSIDCQVTRLKSEYCESQGPYEPMVCAPGYYCPNASLQLACPEGSYCMRGSWQPRACPFMSHCPPGTEMRLFYGGIVVCLILDIAMILSFLYIRNVSEPAFAKSRLALMRKRFGHDGTVGGDINNEVEMLALPDGSGEGAASPGGLSEGGPTPIKLSQGLSTGLPMMSDAKAVLRDGFMRCNSGVSLDLKFEDLGLTLPAPISRSILSGVSGRIQPGRVTAVMGPSGAGKTTFLSVLTGKVNRTSGTLLINGVVGEMHAYRKAVGFVPQDDVMIRELTVRENILFSARMRLPSHGWPDSQVQDYVDAIIEALGLTECANTRIGDVSSRGVSGGQRKRTNIAIELAAFPSALFLDEPTSGLDASAALEVCSTLRSVADLGLTVVAVIHQPRLEIFNSFHDLLLLAPGGRTAYVGPRSGVLPYFTSTLGFTFSAGNNPADQLLDFVAGAAPAPAFSPVHGSASHMALNELGGGTTTTTNGAPVMSMLSQRIAAFSASASPAKGSSSGSSEGASAGTVLHADPLHSPTDLSSPMLGSSKVASGGERRGTGDTDAEDLLSGVGAQKGNAAARAGAYFDLAWRRYGSKLAGLGTADFGSSSSTPTPVGGAAAFATSSSSAHGGVVEGGGASSLTADRGASFGRQMWLCHARSLLQQYRAAVTYALEVGVAGVSGGMMGLAASQLPELYNGVVQRPFTLISPAPLEPIVPSVGMYIALAVGLAGSPAGVLAFGEEKDVFYREAAAGHNRIAYYLAKMVSVIPRFTFGSLHFTAIFHCMASPASEFTDLWVLVFLQFWCVYGLSSIVSMVVKRDQAPLLSVIVSLITGVLCGFGPSLAQARTNGFEWILDSSWARWAAEGWFYSETKWYRDVFMVDEVSAPLFGYTMDRFGWDCFMCILIGAMYRVIAAVLLLGLNRERQR